MAVWAYLSFQFLLFDFLVRKKQQKKLPLAIYFSVAFYKLVRSRSDKCATRILSGRI